MNACLLISSYDGFSDLWPLIKSQFDRCWPSRTWPMYWITNTARTPEGSNPIFVHPDRQWGGNLLAAIDDLPDFILLWCDELIPLGLVHEDLLEAAMKALESDDSSAGFCVGHYYFRKLPVGMDNHPNPLVSVLAESRAVATQPTLWKKAILRKLLLLMQPAFSQRESEYPPASQKGYSPAHTTSFEKDAQRIFSENFPDKHMLRIRNGKIIEDYCSNLIMYGKWIKQEVDRLKELGIDIDASSRGVISY